MKYKYNITHKVNGKSTRINFKSETSLVKYLNQNSSKLSILTNPVVNFSQIALPLKTTVWFDKHD